MIKKLKSASYVASYSKQDRGLLNYLFWGGSKEATQTCCGGHFEGNFRKRNRAWSLGWFVIFHEKLTPGFHPWGKPTHGGQTITVACSQEMDLSTWQRLNRGIETNGTNVPDHVQQQVYALVNKAACSNARFWKEDLLGGHFWKKTYYPRIFSFEDGLNWELHLKMGWTGNWDMLIRILFVNEMMIGGMKTLRIHSVSILQFRSQRGVAVCCDRVGNYMQLASAK